MGLVNQGQRFDRDAAGVTATGVDRHAALTPELAVDAQGPAGIDCDRAVYTAGEAVAGPLGLDRAVEVGIPGRRDRQRAGVAAQQAAAVDHQTHRVGARAGAGAQDQVALGDDAAAPALLTG